MVVYSSMSRDQAGRHVVTSGSVVVGSLPGNSDSSSGIPSSIEGDYLPL